MNNSSQRGLASELIVASKAIMQGFNVSYPIGNFGPYDLILEKDEVFLRVQVKTGYPKKGQKGFHVNTIDSSGGKNYVHSADYIAAYIPSLDICYMIPTKRLDKTRIQLVIGSGYKYSQYCENWNI